MNPTKEKALKIIRYRDWTPPKDMSYFNKYWAIMLIYDSIIISMILLMGHKIIPIDIEVFVAGLTGMGIGNPSLIAVYLIIYACIKHKTKLHEEYLDSQYDWVEVFRV